jgi:membrane protein implicated in regulation of membrane protease activity
MKLTDYLEQKISEFDFLAKYQLAAGVFLLGFGLVVLLFPAVLVGIVAAALMAAGISLIAAARHRRRADRCDVAYTRIDFVDF